MNAGIKNKYIGIEIGGTKLQIAISDAAGVIVSRLRFPIAPANGAAGIRAQLEKSIAGIGAQTIAAAGVGFGGPVDWETGVIQTSHQVEGWSGFNLKHWLEQLTQAPVRVDNDANVAALAEAVQGGGVDKNPVFYITIGSGIGGGVVLNNEIYHGAASGEVEIGHICLDKRGTTLESVCSGWAVDKRVRNHIENYPDNLLSQLAAQCHESAAALLKPALEKGDAAAEELLDAVADDLAFALSHVVHLFHPQVIIVGGGLSLLGEPLRQAIAEKLSHYVMKAFLPAPPVKLALLGENAVPAGALLLARKTQ